MYVCRILQLKTSCEYLTHRTDSGGKNASLGLQIHNLSKVCVGMFVCLDFGATWWRINHLQEAENPT